ncbi:hypothetical protein [Nonomuraea endophytica]|uniref:Uncharacterized protein n=1 Tax=Nonomuraea endophytica TaxID=714136 RepID=A0A7W8A6A6_9ACTN|nr:hypothetical protein [Nonomuraea endophytica]MBB5079535.1 hypothetical protein [Nonomuraea endophytica]
MKRDGAVQGYSPRTFSAGALALLVAALPLFVAWSSGYYGSPPPGVSTLALGAHWVCGWLIPLNAGAVVAYGTAGRVLDRRIVLSAPGDPRTRWWREHGLVLAAVAVVAGTIVAGQSAASGESVARLAVPAISGLVVALCTAQLVVARFGHAPGTACGITTTVTAAVLVGPCLSYGARPFAVDATLHGWMSGDPGLGPPVTAAALAWPALAVAAVAAGRIFPLDAAALSGARDHD